MLSKALSFVKEMVDREHQDSIASTRDYHFLGGMKKWPLNKPLLEEVDQEYATTGKQDYSDIVAVRPHRSQMRSVLIFAVHQTES